MGIEAPTISTTSTPSPTAPLPICAPVLDSLSARMRSNGFFLMLLAADGTLVYHDPAAGVFFRRFILPLLQYSDSAADAIRAKAAALAYNSSQTTLGELPGAMLVAAPVAEKRRLTGVMVLAAKTSSIGRFDEDV